MSPHLAPLGSNVTDHHAIEVDDNVHELMVQLGGVPLYSASTGPVSLSLPFSFSPPPGLSSLPPGHLIIMRLKELSSSISRLSGCPTFVCRAPALAASPSLMR